VIFSFLARIYHMSIFWENGSIDVCDCADKV